MSKYVKDGNGNYHMNGYDYATLYQIETKIYKTTMKAISECYKEYLENVKYIIDERRS